MPTNKPFEKSFLTNGKYLYEMVGDPEKRELTYVQYDRLTGEMGQVQSITKDDHVYIPPQSELGFSGTILLPTKPAEYGSLSELLDSIRSFIDSYLELPSDYLLIASYYVLLTWVYDCFETIPYLRARGEYGTGKSRFLRVIGSLCYRACFAGGSSTVSPIFRIIEMYGGITLVLDEADFRFSGPDVEIVKILNTGYAKGTPVLRTEGDKIKTPKSYNTFGPKILATRKEYSDLALESRCLTNYMTPKTRRDIPIHLPKGFNRLAREIRNQLLMFRLKHYGAYEVDEKQALEGVEPRINQVLLPLFALADTDEMRQELSQFALNHAKKQTEYRAESLAGEILSVVVEIAREGQYVSVKQVAAKLNERRDKEQGERPISPAKIGRVNKESYGFQRRVVNGKTELIWDEQRGVSLCERFGIPYSSPLNLDKVEDVGFVEDLFGSKLSPPDGEVQDKEVKND